MNTKNVVIDNDGDAIDLNSIMCIGVLEKTETSVRFNISFINGSENSLIFEVADYGIDIDMLFNKINSYRTKLIKLWNNNTDPVSFFNKIVLTKKEKTEETKSEE